MNLNRTNLFLFHDILALTLILPFFKPIVNLVKMLYLNDNKL